MVHSEFTIVLIQPRGFCAGVDRAIAIVANALKLYGPPIYVKHEIVHNNFVVNNFKQKGVIFIEDVNLVPIGSRLIFSAHGVSPQIKEQAKLRSLKILDATCPLVTKVHNEATRFALNEYQIVLIGHKEHVEVIGTLGYAPQNIHIISNIEQVAQLNFNASDKLAYITQTTLSLYETAEIIEALKIRFPAIESTPKDDICYATTNRQNAVMQLAEKAELILVVGSILSSNTNRLVETAARSNRNAYLIESAADIDWNWLQGINCVGITAGASAPEELVEEVIQTINSYRPAKIVEETHVLENIEFPLPYELRKLKEA